MGRGRAGSLSAQLRRGGGPRPLSNGSKSGPLRKVVSTRFEGVPFEMLECGHEIVAKRDLVGWTNAVRRRCRKCRATPVKMFPVRGPIGCAKRIAFVLVASSEARALANHGQLLDRLIERGGLNPVELWLLTHDLPSTFTDPPTMDRAVLWINSIAFSWDRPSPPRGRKAR